MGKEKPAANIATIAGLQHAERKKRVIRKELTARQSHVNAPVNTAFHYLASRQIG
jgi:hypothetical protein